MDDEGFDLDLRTVEEQIDEETEGSSGVVLGILDGSTADEEWIGTVDDGDTLVLAVRGDVNQLAAGFAREIHESGGNLVRFREFLIVTPPGVSVDRSRLG
ncbi:hypothetical protein BRD17_00410 [Halobacteriales archaeon SW_7_68_16]|nr:MAG: hypothetical protein BRD17_00410 [Halobacteriales archaeon SW_7_68_16]